ncbi:MAG: 4-hydroxy-tetrahydrodipicolinate synthase [Solirubrobacteraceae bacterium]|jgi:dihydrodipicolinate synthase/N-acetylneuraminate lyase|nr:4-hydroxy-tetrahydrodipicolinate synthase [Solirubrobacteraceae bacterium]
MPAAQSATPLFRGVGVALVTLFDDDGRMLLEQTADHARDLVERGVGAVVVSGSTGESWALSVDERLELCAAVAAAVGDRVPVLVGAGHLDRDDAVVLATAAGGAGAAAVLALSPPGEDDVRPHYEALATAAGATPIVAYHYPALSPPGIALDQLADLPIAGCKDSSGDAERLVAELHAYAGPLYVGSSAYLALAGPLGATGAILALANTDPEGCIAAFGGDLGAQRDLLDAHREAHVDFPAGLKARLARLRGASAAVRPRAAAAAS